MILSFAARAAVAVVAVAVVALFGVQISSGAPGQSLPVLVSADLVESNRLSVMFSEAIFPSSATNLANYNLRTTFGNNVPIVGAILINEANVLLWTGALQSNANHILTATSIPNASGQPTPVMSAAPVARTFRLVAFDSRWDFYDPYPTFPIFDDPDPGPSWNSFGYDPASRWWRAGQGAFGYVDVGDAEPPAPPVPIKTPLSQTPAMATYFRTAFMFNASQSGLNASLRYATDDGAVFYVNAVEAARFNMAAGIPSPSTPAAVAVAAPALVDAPVNPRLLRCGTNLLAVELHQIMPIDVDKYLAVELTVRAESFLAGPMVLLGGPHDATVEENQPVTFRVTAVAASEFQWQVNATNVPGATNATFALRPTLSLDGILVRVICGDGTTSLISTNAVLHVVPDLIRPAVVAARLLPDNCVVVNFSEAVSRASATNIANYAVRDTSGTAVPVMSAVLEAETNVVLCLESALSGRCTVTVSNVMDRATSANAVVPNSSVTVGANYFIGMESAWKFLLTETNSDVQAAFTGLHYDDSSWRGPSNALFYVEGSSLPARENTRLVLRLGSLGGSMVNTYYFRQRVFTPVTAPNVAFRIRHIIDDGLVLHFNGQEIYRFNMPAGPITAASQGRHVENAVLVGPLDVPVTNLLTGTNVLAAEVHQNGTSSADIVFGVQVEIDVPSSMVLPRIEIIPASEQFSLRWNAPGFFLESAPTVTGPWTIVNGTSPVLVRPTNMSRFYRLRQ